MALVARAWYRLPYWYARMRCRHVGDGIRYSSRRVRPRAPVAAFKAWYRPTGPVFSAELGSLEAWLTDRYCLYTGEVHGTVLRGEIDHAPWSLQPAEARLQVDSLVASHGIRLPDTLPLLHFSRRLTMHAWLPESIR